MLQLPVIRWGEPYESLEVDQVVHFTSGEPMAKVSQAVGGLVERDARKAQRARDCLKQLDSAELIQTIGRAAELYLRGTLPMGDGSQSPDEFVRAQSASTGLPEHMCRANMQKNHFVLTHMDQILDALTRGLDLSILQRGYGQETRGVIVSYQVQTPVVGAVLPSNSPGVHTLWLPIIPMQVGLVLKPGPQEPWTPYRMVSAMVTAGVPREAISIYPGGGDVGAAVVAHCPRTMIFGGTETVERYKGDARVQVHGPGFSKILIGDDQVDRWEEFLDLMEESVSLNSGRSCINCSAIYASRHTRDIARALAERLGPIDVKPPEDPTAGLAAFTVPGAAAAIWKAIEVDLQADGAEHATAPYGARLIERERCAYLRPTVIRCASPDVPIGRKEYMFPFVSVVECPQDRMLSAIGPTLVCTALTDDLAFRQALIDAPHIDRLNLGPIPTTRLNWLQPHEGNIVDFLYRARALQVCE
jgi:acyl-CoA reductase-like NAD-dependent aldehyde dehydrogenase